MAAALISMAPLRTRDRNIFLVIDFQSQFEGLGRLFLAAISSNWNAVSLVPRLVKGLVGLLSAYNLLKKFLA